ncbi:hypothetical protein TNCV_2619511 [Trichonephila clavipes]|uniref:Uncharacterized protein n=1 Tax=Trichonephila clavipes TaxID=2585209 RepID=A0A8X6WIU4_TRICX|nr:hypothetical protein TNCV_2619511 [Trichonephila clavipes]
MNKKNRYLNSPPHGEAGGRERPNEDETGVTSRGREGKSAGRESLTAPKRVEEHQKRSGKENAVFFCCRNEKNRVCKVAKRTANLEPVHSSPSSNNNAAFQPFQDGLFHHFDFVSKCLIAMPSLYVPTTNQVAPSPPRTATQSGTINNYDMGWRLALRSICPATDNGSVTI